MRAEVYVVLHFNGRYLTAAGAFSPRRADAREFATRPEAVDAGRRTGERVSVAMRIKNFAPVPKKKSPGRELTEEQRAHLDEVFGAVIDHAPEFSDFQVVFAMDNTDRLARFGTRTLFTNNQWEVIEDIEKQVEELGL